MTEELTVCACAARWRRAGEAAQTAESAVGSGSEEFDAPVASDGASPVTAKDEPYGEAARWEGRITAGSPEWARVFR